MTKSVNSSPSALDLLKRRQAQIEAADAQPLTERDMAQILVDLDAADANVRAAALCRLSPCHMPWAVFTPLRQALKRLQKDASPTVRELALHVEQDAEVIATREALRNLTVEDDDDGLDEWKQRERKRNKQRHRRRGDNDD
jgi:hypothetical protein